MDLLKRNHTKVRTSLDDFFYAAEKGDLETLKKLLTDPDNDVTVNIQNSVGKTALILAAHNGREDVVEYLCQQGADQTIHGRGGYTAADYVKNMQFADKIMKILNKYSNT